MTKTVTTGKATDLITFTRSTTGTYLDSVKYGDELVTNGTFDSNLDGWSGAGWVWSDGKAYDSGPTVTDGLEQIIPTVANAYYVIEYTLSGISGGTPSVQFRGQSAIIHDSDVTNGKVIVQALAATSKVELIGGAATFYIDNISVKEIIGNQGTSGEPLLRTADTNKPRIEYDADGNLKGLLIEEQRTNKVPYSQDFTQSEWLKESVTVATAPVAAPDGTMTATHVVKTGANGHLVDIDIVTTSDRHSIWARSVSGTGTMYIAYQSSDALVTLTEEWQRFDVQCNGNHVYAANFRGSATLTECYIWGSQAETGTFPTSYIPTSGSTVTRNADVATISTGKFEYNENESCVLIEASFLGRDSGEYPRLLDFAQGVNTSSIWATSTAVNIDKSGVGAQATVLWDMTPSKIAASVTSGDIALVVNDSTVDTSTATLVTTSTQFTIGAAEGGTQRMSGHIKSIKYYPVRLTNNQLKALTQ